MRPPAEPNAEPVESSLHSHALLVALGGVVVNVLATGPKVAGSNPAEAMDF
jgi:hypothetical protein